MNVLYIGSGKSATLFRKVNLDNYVVVCVNNAWRLFEDNTFDIWIHSGDFPIENSPKIKNYHTEISFKEYDKAANEIIKKLNVVCQSPAHYLGYTVFFNGLYWIMNDLKPKKISLLGFDHDYNPDKVQKWIDNDKPNPQNHYLKPSSQSIHDWSNEFFKDMKHDSFYGHGTPDPIRLGEDHLISKFHMAISNAEKLGIDLVNLSPIQSKINVIKKEKI
jgi:hypothetical protein